VRREQGASFLAEMYGRVTGKAGVCAATLGPGGINLLLGTAEAFANSSPLGPSAVAANSKRCQNGEEPAKTIVRPF